MHQGRGARAEPRQQAGEGAGLPTVSVAGHALGEGCPGPHFGSCRSDQTGEMRWPRALGGLGRAGALGTLWLCLRALPHCHGGIRSILRGSSPEGFICSSVRGRGPGPGKKSGWGVGAHPLRDSPSSAHRVPLPRPLSLPNPRACWSRANDAGSFHKTTDFNEKWEGEQVSRGSGDRASPLSFPLAKPRYRPEAPPPHTSRLSLGKEGRRSGGAPCPAGLQCSGRPEPREEVGGVKELGTGGRQGMRQQKVLLKPE